MKKRYEVTHPTPIRVNTIERIPGEIFEEDNTHEGLKPLIANNYIKEVK